MQSRLTYIRHLSKTKPFGTSLELALKSQKLITLSESKIKKKRMNQPLNFKAEFLAVDDFVQVDTVSRLNQSSQSMNFLSPKPTSVS